MEKKKEIYTYRSPWTAYTMSWCGRQEEHNKFKIAIGSYKEQYSNHLSIIQLQRNTDGVDETDRKFVKLSDIEHPYPATKIMWAPSTLDSNTSTGQAGSSIERDLIATTGDYLRIWSVSENKLEINFIDKLKLITNICPNIKMKRLITKG